MISTHRSRQASRQARVGPRGRPGSTRSANRGTPERARREVEARHSARTEARREGAGRFAMRRARSEVGFVRAPADPFVVSERSGVTKADRQSLRC